MVNFGQRYVKTRPSTVNRKKIAELDGTDGQPKIIVYGYESYFSTSKPIPNEYVRRYDVMLKYPTEAESLTFIKGIGGNPQSMNLGGEIKLFNVSGRERDVAVMLEDMAFKLSGVIDLPKEALTTAIMEDAAKHQHKYGKTAEKAPKRDR